MDRWLFGFCWAFIIRRLIVFRMVYWSFIQRFFYLFLSYIQILVSYLGHFRLSRLVRFLLFDQTDTEHHRSSVRYISAPLAHLDGIGIESRKVGVTMCRSRKSACTVFADKSSTVSGLQESQSSLATRPTD